MRVASGRWPSAGFLAVCATYSLTAAFFVWGFSTPDLDRVWTLHHELKIGQTRRLKARDRALLETCMARHPRLAGALLEDREIGLISAHRDGWLATPTATLLRTEKSAEVGALLLEIQTPRDLLPYRIVVRGRDWTRRLEVTAQGRLQVELPAAPPAPEVVEVRLRGRSFEPDPSVLGVHLSFGERP